MAGKAASSSVDKKKNAKRGGSGKLVFFMIVLGCMVPFGIPTLLVCLGLLPTLVALFTDSDSHRSGLATIGYMNLAGVLPFLVELWQKDQTMEAALGIVKDPASWVIMLGAAGVGQLMLYAIPPFVASMVLIRQESRLKTLREGVQQLEAIWGPDVANTLPLETVRAHKN